jgi:ribosomal protein L16/L10AE
VPFETATEALRLAAMKLSVPTRLIRRPVQTD